LENTDVDTTYVLSHTSVRQNLVNQIISAAIQYNLDGINLDFEALDGTGVGDSYIQFVRELSLKCANNGIVLSVDNYVPSAYTAFYDRAEQALFADYVVIMGYDEHFAGDDEAGSVASLSWVTDAVQNTLVEVPSDQIILGMPFYTRVWCKTPNNDASDTEIIYSLTSQAYGMSSASKLVESNNAEKVWLDDCGQFYAEYESDGSTYMIWLEDSSSAEERLRLLDTYSLAGASFWKLGFETSDIWDTVIKYIN
jgi:spore germination protein YaaH